MCFKRTVKISVSVMVWGCMTALGVGALHIVLAMANAEK